MRIKSVGLDDSTVKRVRNSIASQLAQTTNAPLVPEKKMTQAEALTIKCQSDHLGRDEDECAVVLGKTLHASHVISCAIGQLNQTYMIKLKVINVKKESVVRTLEETVLGRTHSITQVTGHMASQLFERISHPWYKRWWVWTALTVGIAALAITLPLALSSDEPYEKIALP